MIASLRGTLLVKEAGRVVLDVGGVGYEIHVTATVSSQLPDCGHEVLFHIEQSFGMYGGGATFYGFLTAQERALFVTFKENIPSTGAKKALEYLDRASKSLPDFRRAILEKDGRILSGVFGFTKKTADRLVEALKDKLDGVSLAGVEKFPRQGAGDISAGALAQALNALSSLGYKPAEARTALAAVAEDAAGKKMSAEEIVRLALKRL